MQNAMVMDAEGHIRKIAKESGIGVVGSLIGTGFTYLATILGARFLGASDYGIFVLARTVCNVAFMIASFGMPKAFDRFLPQFISSGQIGKARQLISTLLHFSCISGILIGFTVFLMGNFIVGGKLGLILSVMAITIPLTLFIELCVYVFSGLKELRYEVIVKRIIIPVVYIALGIMVIVFHLGLIGWVWAFILANLVGLIFAIYYFRKKIWSWLKNEPPTDLKMNKVVRYFLPLGLSGMILFLTAQINILFLGYYSTAKDVAIFSIYLSVLGILSMVRTSIGRIYKPVLAGILSSDSQSEAQHNYQTIYNRTYKWILLINLFGIIVILFFGNKLVRLIVGSEYIISPLAFQVLTISALVDYVSGLCFETLEATGKGKSIMIISLLMLLLSLILNPLLIPSYGILGAAIAYLIVFSIANLLAIILVWKQYQLSPFNKRSLRILLLFVSMCLFLQWVNAYVINGVLVAIFFVALYFVGVFVLRIYDKEDLDILKLIVNRIRVNKILQSISL
ncbi:MAG: polysaccharide biosynthesis C-terminal domain-containing protein [bacterium]